MTADQFQKLVKTIEEGFDKVAEAIANYGYEAYQDADEEEGEEGEEGEEEEY